MTQVNQRLPTKLKSGDYDNFIENKLKNNYNV
jgi:hypothetical protein